MQTRGTVNPSLLDIKVLTKAGLETFVAEAGFPAYRGRQLFEWLHRHGASSFDEMHTLPSALRRHLSGVAEIRILRPSDRALSLDGTVKTLFRLSTGRAVETVLIPDVDPDGTANRLTVCVSSQVGCAMGCTFCATGRMGFHQDLTASEIADQVFAMNRLALEKYGRSVTNVVYMGMGEPLLNFDALLGSVALLTDEHTLGMSPKRITISTVGVADRIRRLADADLGTRLAISLHAPDDTKRSSIMPINRRTKTDLRALHRSVVYYHQKTGQPVTYEYCMFDGFNDTDSDAANLVAVTRWAPSKVNLIMYNPVDGTGFSRTSETRLNAFISRLVTGNVRVTVRRSRGQDIAAACGQLAGQTAG